MRPVHRMPGVGLLGAALLAAAAVACGSAAAPTRDTVDDPQTDERAVADPDFGFPTGPAVLVPPDYDPADDRVDSTGAHLPVNGKPTLVYLEAIW